MSDIIFLLIGFALGVVFCAFSIRRAKKKPEGKTAKAVNVIFGPGPWTPPKQKDGPGPFRPPQ